MRATAKSHGVQIQQYIRDGQNTYVLDQYGNIYAVRVECGEWTLFPITVMVHVPCDRRHDD